MSTLAANVSFEPCILQEPCILTSIFPPVLYYGFTSVSSEFYRGPSVGPAAERESTSLSKLFVCFP